MGKRVQVKIWATVENHYNQTVDMDSDEYKRLSDMLDQGALGEATAIEEILEYIDQDEIGEQENFDVVQFEKVEEDEK